VHPWTQVHTTEIDKVNKSSQAAKEPGLSAHNTAYSAEINTSPSEARPRQVLDVLPSQQMPPAIPTDVIESQPFSSKYDDASIYIIGESTEEQTKQSEYGLENLDEGELSSSAQMQELPFGNEHPFPLIISDQVQSPMSRSEHPSWQEGPEGEIPEENSQPDANRTDTYDSLTKTQSIKLVKQGGAKRVQSKGRMLRPRNMHSSIMYALE